MTGLGFAGVGGLGEALVRDLPKFPTFRIAGVQDVDPVLAADVARRHGSPWEGTEYADLLACPAVDAVVICTPNALHVPQARLALQAGKHVLVQKPLALSCADAAAAVELAGRRERLLFVDYTYRYVPTVAALRDALASIGPVRRASAAFHNIYGPGKGWFFDPAMSGGGALTDLGVHLLDLALDLLRPESVVLEEANLRHERSYQVEDHAQLRLRLDEVPLELAVSWNSDRPTTEIGLRIEGAHGSLRWENVNGSFFCFRTSRDGVCLLEQETTLREDTLRAFATALERGVAPAVDLRVYELLDRAYGHA